MWKSTTELGSVSYGDNVASMAWGARNFISTQGRAAGDLDGVVHGSMYSMLDAFVQPMSATADVGVVPPWASWGTQVPGYLM